MSVETDNTLTVEATRNPQSALAQHLALMEEQTMRLETEVSLENPGTYPGWWQQEAVPTGLVRQELKKPGVDPIIISQYFHLRQRQQRLHAIISGREYGLSPLVSFCSEVGGDIAARGFQSEGLDGPMHIAMLERLASSVEDREYVVPELELLRHAYGVERITDLLGIGGDEYSDMLRPLVRNENAVKWMRFVDQKKSSDYSMEEARVNAWQWMSQALSSATGIGGGRS